MIFYCQICGAPKWFEVIPYGDYFEVWRYCDNCNKTRKFKVKPKQ